MHLVSVGTLVALAASIAVPLAPSVAEESDVAVLAMEGTIGCFGCGTYGPAGNSMTGTVVAGEGGFQTGAAVTSSFTVNEGTGVGCVVSGTASGVITTSDGTTESFHWTRVGALTDWTFGSGATGTGTFAVADPDGLPCGRSVRFRATVGLRGGTRGPRPKGHVTLHRFPVTADHPLGGVRFLVAPRTQSGTLWSCRDIRNGAYVQEGAILASPDPGVECTPPGGFTNRCTRVDVGGYALTGSGSLTAQSTCQGVGASVTMQIPAAVNYAPPARGNGLTPWRCAVDETIVDAAVTEWWVFCDANNG